MRKACVLANSIFRLYHRRDEMYDRVRGKYLQTGTVTKVLTSRRVAKRASSVGLAKS